MPEQAEEHRGPRQSHARQQVLQQERRQRRFERKRGLKAVLSNGDDYAAWDDSAGRSTTRFHGNSSSMRLTGWSGIRENTSRK